ncbi:MAG: tetratricopeptide repeat protein [Candidatus Bipolaricaulota bacterium]|nr:tetratricopeptide repeat protein [Candidatus Bipolaricaulota bacterium]
MAVGAGGAAMSVEVFLFGRFEARRDGEPLTWRNAKTQALLKILASERGRVFSAEELIEYLWPEEEKNLQSAASNLRARVAELRRVLEPDLTKSQSSRYIETRRGGYAFSAEAECWIDAEEFARCEEEGRRAARAGRLDEAIALYERAVALYRGEYLEEDRYEEWAVHARERWRERYVELLSELADALAQAGRYREALHTIRRAIERSPLHEQLYRQWMVYAHGAGEPAEVRRAYLRCREVLERELGERPSSRTEEIYKQLQRGEMAEIQERYPIERSVVPALNFHRLPFCGRRREWQQLHAALQKARRGGLVLISGEPGMGKTRLCEEFCAEVKENAQTLLLTGRCLEMKNPLPLHPWLEALHAGVGNLSLEQLGHVHPLWLAECAELLPALRSVIPQLPHEVSLPAEHRPYRIFETLFQILCALARQRTPLLIFLDDLQWADEDSVDLLCYVIGKGADLPLMILATARSGTRANNPLLATLQDHARRHHWLAEIELKSLSISDIQDLIVQMRVEAPSQAAERLHRESMGNPLFLGTILQALFENGCFTAEGDGWRLQLPAQIPTPLQIKRVIEHRIARVGPAAQRLLQMIACAGQIELEALERAWDGTSQELFAHLDDLIAQGILSEHHGRYEFAHDKYREVIYSALEEPRRVWLHRRLAQALESTYAEPTIPGLAARVAEHYKHGKQPHKALASLFTALESCRRSYRIEEGLTLAAQGLSLLEDHQDRLSHPEEKAFWLHEARAELLLHAGRSGESKADIERLNSIATCLQDLRKIARAHLLQAQCSEDQDNPADSLRSAQQALHAYQTLQDRHGQAHSLYHLARAYYWMRDYSQAVEISHQARKLAQETEDTALLARVLNVLGSASWELGDRQRAWESLQKALALSRQIRDLQTESDLLNDLGAICWELGDFGNSLDLFRRALALSREIGDRLGTTMILTNLGGSLTSLGHYTEALSLLREAQQISTELGNPVESARVQRQLAFTLSGLGDHAQALATVQNSYELCRENDDVIGQAESLRIWGEICYASHQVSQGIASINKALQTPHAAQSALFFARCQIVLSKLYLRQDRPHQALQAADKALQSLEHLSAPHLALEAHYRRYQALSALHSPQALQALETTQALVRQVADKLTDPALRQSFLNLPLHQEILTSTPPR